LSVAAVVAFAALVFFLCTSSKFRAWFLVYGSVPIVAAIVGWGTNVVALYMTFYPLEYIGFCPSVKLFGLTLFGWQGIIPSKSKKMAAQTVDLMMEHLIDVQEVFSRVDPDRFAEDLLGPLRKLTPELLEMTAMERAPGVWRRLPVSVRQELANKCIEDSPLAIRNMMNEIRGDIKKVFDLKQMVIDLSEQDKNLGNDLFLKCGAKEFSFIKVSGFYLGLLFGIAQMVLWMLYQGWWVLPTAGFVVGFLTNYVALKIIFEPVEPKPLCCGITLQGLFLQRQKEVAVTYAEMVSSRILTAENLLSAMLTGPCSNDLFVVVEKHVQQGIDHMVEFEGLAKMVVGSEDYAAMKARISKRLLDEAPKFISPVTGYVDEALHIKQTLESSINQLSSAEFEGLLHPVFQEDELTLILVGGMLGVAVGMMQAIIQVPEQLGISL
jgi:uncharacterized membrane protein YheB (UPF0754 family)